MNIFIDSFTYTLPISGDQTIEIYFDNSSQAITVQHIGTGSAPTSVTAAQRGRANNELIGDITSQDGGTSYTLKASLNTPFAFVSGSVPIIPNPPICDLTLEAIATNETFQNAKNGSVALNATSTFTPIKYRLSTSGPNFTERSYYTALPPGNYIGYSKDANGCLASAAFTIEGFNNPIEGGFDAGLPQVTVSPGNVSRWNAAFNPIILNFSTTPNPSRVNFRMEVEITTQQGIFTGRFSPDPLGKTRCDIAALIQPSVNARDDFQYNAIVYRDFNRSASFTIRYREVWDSGSSVWFNAPQPFYATYSAKQLGELYGGNMAEYVPMQAGGVINPAVFTYKVVESSTPYVDVNLQGKQNGTEVLNIYSNATGSISMGVGNLFSFEAYVNSPSAAANPLMIMVVRRNNTIVFRKTVASIPGASLAYTGTVSFNTNYSVEVTGRDGGAILPDINIPDVYEPVPTGSSVAKWLTVFDEPSAWVGLPYDNSFIFSEYYLNVPVKLRTTSLDINRRPIGVTSNNGFILNNSQGYVLRDAASRLIIKQSTVPTVQNDNVPDSLGINRLMLAGVPGPNVEYFQIQLYTGPDESPSFITRPLVIKMNKPCSDRYVYLKWLNTLGGWEYWRFGKNQTESIVTSNADILDRNVFDWAKDDTIADLVKKKAVSRFQIGAQISNSKIRGVSSLHRSIKVQMLVNTNPIAWQTVIVDAGTFEIRKTKYDYTELKFTINLPETNIQHQ